MNKPNYAKVLKHPDKDEIISKLVIGISPKDVNEWLASKYSSSSEHKFVISEKTLAQFQSNYLDIYNYIQQDIASTKQAAITNTQDDLQLSVQNNSDYKKRMLEIANNEIDVRKMVANLCVNIEFRLGQIFDAIQEDPRSINTRVDRVSMEYARVLGEMLERYYKFTESPQQLTVQHNVTLQVVDQHISVFHDVIREVLAQMDLETSLYFMEVFNQKMAQLKAPDHEAPMTTDVKMAEAKLLNESINQRLNGTNDAQS